MTNEERRKAFEAWLASTPYPRSPLRNGEGYMFAFNQATWEAWQAATAAERERCAKVAELSHPEDWAFIGAAIRNG